MSHFLYSGRQKLTYNAENVKHILSTLDTANCYIESLYEGIDFNANVTRARFENELAKVSLTQLTLTYLTLRLKVYLAHNVQLNHS
jgi:molecular chaperone DnaK (HSP70)